MNCKCCNAEIPDDMDTCSHCGADITTKRRSWHYIYTLLWGSKIDQDLLDTLNEFNREKEHADHFVDMTLKLNENVEK